MLKLKRGKPEGTPVETEISISGIKVPMTIIPCEDEEFYKDMRQFRKSRMVHNPVTKQMERIEYWEDKNAEYKKIAEEKLDRHLLNFTAIDENGEPIDGSKKENKLLFAGVIVEDHEEVSLKDEEGNAGFVLRPRRRAVMALIFDQITELARASIEAVEGN